MRDLEPNGANPENMSVDKSMAILSIALVGSGVGADVGLEDLTYQLSSNSSQRGVDEVRVKIHIKLNVLAQTEEQKKILSVCLSVCPCVFYPN